MVFSKKINNTIVLFGLADHSPMIELTGDLVSAWTQLEASREVPASGHVAETYSALIEVLVRFQMIPEGHDEKSLRAFFSVFPAPNGDWKIIEMLTPVEVAASVVEDGYGTCSWAGYGEPPFHTYMCFDK